MRARSCHPNRAVAPALMATLARCPMAHCRCGSASSPPNTPRSPRPAASATSPRRSPATSPGAATTCASSCRCTGRWNSPASTVIRSTSCAGLPLRVGPHEFRYDVQTARVPDTDLWVYLVDCPALFDRPRIYSDAPDEHVRYLALTRAAFECCQRMGFAPDVMHSNDWHTALAPLLLRARLRLGPRHLRRDAQRVHDPQHRLPGRLLRRSRGGPRPRRRASRHCTRPTSRAGRINPMRLGILLRRRRDDRESRATRRKSARPREDTGSTATCARAANR